MKGGGGNRTRGVLQEYGYQAKKRRGQNFLVREDTLRLIAAAAELSAADTVLEIGPGPGNLTRHLCAVAGRVIAVEVEHELALILRAELRATNLTVVEADALALDFAALAPAGGRLTVVANLPYNITTPMLFKLLATPAVFSRVLLLIQKEVAERITAPAGGKPYGILAAQTQLAFSAEIVFVIGPEGFSPRPKVDSALIRLTPRDRPLAELVDPERFRRVVRAAFAQRRKTLRNSLIAALAGYSPARIDEALAHAGIDPGRRAESLAVTEFAGLANAMGEGDI
jgi:16S rRNA (adenine1518-N6/adenine1519-N6)-dimethyltransferase